MINKLNSLIKIPWLYFLIIFCLLMITFSVCKKEPSLPSVKTLNIDDVSDETAIVEYEITGDGGAMVMQHGVCWSLDANPTILLATKTLDGSDTGSAPGVYLSVLNGLAYGKTYHTRAYASNSVGTAYGFCCTK